MLNRNSTFISRLKKLYAYERHESTVLGVTDQIR